jgi:hypothetical protein
MKGEWGGQKDGTIDGTSMNLELTLTASDYLTTATSQI